MQFLVESDLSLMSFIVTCAMCSCIGLVMDATFWRSDLFLLSTLPSS
jgi:hypothetical protein